jgi:hypothetical protein
VEYKLSKEAIFGALEMERLSTFGVTHGFLVVLIER